MDIVDDNNKVYRSEKRNVISPPKTLETEADVFHQLTAPA